MSLDLNPPTTASPGSTPPPAPERSSAKVVAILAMSLGGVLLLGALVSGLGSIAYAAGDRGTGSRAADATGVRSLSLDVSAGHVVVQYADVDEAVLDISGGDRDWRLERQGDTLALSNDRPWWAFQAGFDWSDSRATLTLPESLETEKIDARFEVSAGSITADGTYGDLQVDVGAGGVDVTGTADDVTVEVSAGSADVTVDGARTADLQIGAGEILASITGDALRDVRVDVSAGTLIADLPDADYDVTSDVSAGSFDNNLSTSTGAQRSVDVRVSAGSVTLNPGD